MYAKVFSTAAELAY